MTDINNDDKNEVQKVQTPDLYTLSAKLFAIGELIKFRSAEPSLEEERLNFGIGQMLIEVADEMVDKQKM